MFEEEEKGNGSYDKSYVSVHLEEEKSGADLLINSMVEKSSSSRISVVDNSASTLSVPNRDQRLQSTVGSQ